MTLLKSDFLRPFSIGFALGAVMIALNFAVKMSGLLA